MEIRVWKLRRIWGAILWERGNDEDNCNRNLSIATIYLEHGRRFSLSLVETVFQLSATIVNALEILRVWFHPRLSFIREHIKYANFGGTAWFRKEFVVTNLFLFTYFNILKYQVKNVGTNFRKFFSPILRWIYPETGSYHTNRADSLEEDKLVTTAKREPKGNGILIWHRCVL